MKKKSFLPRVRITFEPNRFSENQLIRVYEQLAPVNCYAIKSHDPVVLPATTVCPAIRRNRL
ncbi:Uncharacterised protein [Serratia quinivorans]|nr:Uncharacterised protein [Serratia quinivorans]CAI1607670.1 Uncharacterised protein [Serratia quinivorans]